MVMEMLVDVWNLLLKRLMARKESITHPRIKKEAVAEDSIYIS